MAGKLVACDACKVEMSKVAKACPSCGHPNKKANHLSGSQVLGGFAIAFIGIWFFSGDSGGSGTAPVADEETRQIAWVRKGKEAVQAKLKDPDSAQFKDVIFVQKANEIPVACGEVNSKNSFGAYAGFQHFVSAGSPENTYLESEVEDFAELWNKLCVK